MVQNISWWDSRGRGVIVAAFLVGVVIGIMAVYSGPIFGNSSSEPISMAMLRESGVPVKPDSAFAFYVMGDTPYGLRDEASLRHQIGDMHSHLHEKALFVVHVGDLQKYKVTNCSEEAFVKTKDYLVQLPLTALVIPGDNDYHLCPNPKVGWHNFENYFMHSERDWEYPDLVRPLPFNVTRWEKCPEMFVFVREGVLFLSVNLVDVRPKRKDLQEEYDSRMQDVLFWVRTNVEEMALREEFRGVIIFGHSIQSPDTRPFFDGLETIFKGKLLLIPVLYIHGDGHQFDLDDRFSQATGWDSYRAVQVDRGGAADPILVEVAKVVGSKTVPLVKEKEMHYVLGDGLFRIDRRMGRYKGREED